jgi:hypothetical protein
LGKSANTLELHRKTLRRAFLLGLRHIMIGTKLAHYEITSHLGTGGMGEVYQATDSKLGRSVAIKLLPAAFASDPDRLSRFRREAQVLASLNHSNIAHIYGLGEDASAGPYRSGASQAGKAGGVPENAGGRGRLGLFARRALDRIHIRRIRKI